ncbi:hypothetical protein N665_0986s0001 [Sinapis alba]|nr:hypothetical protein N665_0986s0001 [Sinapis alba]
MDQSGEFLMLPFSTVKADHISLLIRLILSAYKYVWVDFSWPDGPVWTVLGPSREYGWLIVSAYQYVLVIFHPISTYGSTFHGLMELSGQFLVHPGSTDDRIIISAVRMAACISLSVRIGHFSSYQYGWVDFSWPDGPIWTVLGPSRQYGWLIVSAYQYVWVIFILVWTVLGPSRQYGWLIVSAYQYMDSNFSLDRETRNKDDEEDLQTPDSDRVKRKSTSGATSQASQAKRIIPTRSEMWEHFTRTKEDRDMCLCNYCHKDFSYLTTSGTSNLKKHHEICKNYKAWSAGQVDKQDVINKEGKLKKAKFTDTMFREATNEMLVLGQLPLAFVESVAWRHFCNKANYTPHSRRSSTKYIVKLYVEKKEALKKWFSCNKQRVSIKIDIWVSQTTGASYMVVSVHFIDEFWRLNKLIFGFKHITDHKGQTIASVLLECLADWGIEKVFCITVDNASVNSSALRKFHSAFALVSDQAFVFDGEFLHLRCSSHIINLIVRDGMAEIDHSVSAIRNAISYVRSHTNRLRSFECKVDSGKITRGSLPFDVKTRWNST